MAGFDKRLFDRSALCLAPLSARQHDLQIDVVKELAEPPGAALARRFPQLIRVAECVAQARKNGAAVVLMIGGHVIRSGLQKYIIDLLERGYISCIAMNGAVMIHDYEFAFAGATTESVARYIQDGQFGLWQETGILNDIISRAYREDDGSGMGAAVGRAIAESDCPYRDVSLLASCYRIGIPATVHVGIGYDIIHEHPNCDGAATGALSYNDFLRFAAVMQNLEGGVVMNFGSAVMAPEVYLKALGMARNVARQQGKEIRRFTTLVCDLHDLPDDFAEEPPKDSAAYYFRPWKTMLVRTVADGGTSYYVKGLHAETIPALWTAINKAVTE